MRMTNSLLSLVFLTCSCLLWAQVPPSRDDLTIDSLRQRAAAGDVKAQTQLGNSYLFGKGVMKDVAQAVLWFKKAAERGDANAECALGSIYSAGLQGVPLDYSEAVRWYRKAAEQGNASGQYNLGMMYSTGQGVPQDSRLAMTWFRKSAEQGDMGGEYGIAGFYANGQGVPQDYAQAASWFRKSAEQGFSPAETNLGVMYLKGMGVPKDNAQARMWFTKAAGHGYEPAKKWLQTLDSGEESTAAKASTDGGSSTLRAPNVSAQGLTQQSVPPPPRPPADGPSLEVTMKFIQDKLNAEGKVNFAAKWFYPDGTFDANAIFRYEDTNLVADPASCQITYHDKFGLADAGMPQLDNSDHTFNFRDVQDFVVKTGEQQMKKLNDEWAQQGRSAAGLYAQIDSPIFVLVARRPRNQEDVFFFTDEDMANRVAKAMVHAVELCGGEQKEAEPF